MFGKSGAGSQEEYDEGCYARRACFFPSENLTKCYLPYTLHSRVLPHLHCCPIALSAKRGLHLGPSAATPHLGRSSVSTNRGQRYLPYLGKYSRVASFLPLRSQSRDDWTNDMPSVQVSHPWLYHGTSGSGTSDEASSPRPAITCGFLTRFGSRLGPYAVGFFFSFFRFRLFLSTLLSLSFFHLAPCFLLLGRRLLDSGLRPRILGLDINRLLRTCTFSFVYFSHDIYVKNFSDQSSHSHMSRPFSNACQK